MKKRFVKWISKGNNHEKFYTIVGLIAIAIVVGITGYMLGSEAATATANAAV